MLKATEKMPTKNVKPVDRLVGENIRAHRLTIGLTQEELAGKIGLTFQQVQKYEKGANRVSGSRLIQIAEALNVPVVSLFEGADTSRLPNHSELSRFITNRGAIRLLRAFSKIKRAASQQALVTLAEEMAGE